MRYLFPRSLAVLLAIACGPAAFAQSAAELAGKWVMGDNVNRKDTSFVLELNADGKGSMGGLAITWAAEGGKLKITSNGKTYDYTPQLKGGSLTLSGSDLDTPLTFTRDGAAPAGPAVPATPATPPSGKFDPGAPGPMGPGAPTPPAPGPMVPPQPGPMGPPANANAGAGDAAKFLGDWHDDEETYTFRPNGTALFEGEEVRYRVENGRLIVVIQGRDTPVGYRFDGNDRVQLIFAADDVSTLTRGPGKAQPQPGPPFGPGPNQPGGFPGGQPGGQPGGFPGQPQPGGPFGPGGNPGGGQPGGQPGGFPGGQQPGPFGPGGGQPGGFPGGNQPGGVPAPADIRQILPGTWTDSIGQPVMFAPDGTMVLAGQTLRWQADAQGIVFQGPGGQMLVQYRIESNDRISLNMNGRQEVITRARMAPGGMQPGGMQPGGMQPGGNPGGFGPGGPGGGQPGGFGPGGNPGGMGPGNVGPGNMGPGGMGPGGQPGGFGPGGNPGAMVPGNPNANIPPALVGVWSDGQMTSEFRADGVVTMGNVPMQFTADATSITFIMLNGQRLPARYRIEGTRLVISMNGQDTTLNRVR